MSFKLTSAIVLYVGFPTMGGVVGKVKSSTILLVVVGMVIRDKYYQLTILAE